MFFMGPAEERLLLCPGSLDRVPLHLFTSTHRGNFYVRGQTRPSSSAELLPTELYPAAKVFCLAEGSKLTVSVLGVKGSLKFTLHEEVVVVRVDSVEERQFLQVVLTE